MTSTNFVLILTVVACVNAAVWRSALPEKPKEFAHIEGCYIKEENKVVPFGTKVVGIGYCYKIICGEKYLNYASCGSLSTNTPYCYVSKNDLTKPYPDCCPKIKCNEGKTI